MWPVLEKKRLCSKCSKLEVLLPAYCCHLTSKILLRNSVSVPRGAVHGAEKVQTSALICQFGM